MNLNEFRKLPILGIVRGIEGKDLEPLFNAAQEGGLRTIEITMNTSGAPTLIRTAVRRFGKSLSIGAGTVLDLKDLGRALDAGASFIVSPVADEKVMRVCARKKIPVFPGALTPTEIYRAWTLGATMVKVFPAGFFGPKYFKEIKGPFNDIELLACAGVTAENQKDYFAAGASAVTFGASVFRKEWIAARNWSKIRGEVRRFVDGCRGL